MNLPALRAYIERIGAEELNFRKFMVKMYRGGHYYVERCIIRITPDGEINCSNKEYAPTKEEADAIRAEVKAATFPRSIEAGEAQLRELRKRSSGESTLYEFWNRAGDGIIMVQERCIMEGRKAYLPWSFWSDGEWRRMEPDGPLPFWKPRRRTGLPRLMIHEGAKTAEYLTRLIESGGEHPWRSELERYEHWGMIGGALAPHRADYSEVGALKMSEVVYVCDNDYPGKAALKEVSRCYGHAIKGIMFDERWPASWDLADPLPAGMFVNGRYVGPKLESLVQLATWATEMVPPAGGGPGRPAAALRREFAEEWFHCVTPEVFVHRDWPSVIMTTSEFNNRVRPFSDVEDTGRLVKGDAASKSGTLRYWPGMAPGIYVDENGMRFINTHTPSPIDAEKGDVGPFLEFMERLCPVAADRRELLRWCATLIARPGRKMLYGVLLISEAQGVGKGTLGEKILAPLVGEINVSYPSESDIVESNFNYWAAHKRLAVVHEIYAGHSAKAYNKLKSLITDKSIDVNKKHQANYTIENWLHIFACSNSLRAMQLSQDDRRWFVPKVTEEKVGEAYWRDLNRWLREEGGLGKIRWWAEHWDEGYVGHGDIAPYTARKQEVIEEGWSPGQVLVGQFLDRAREEFNGTPVVILDTDLVKMVKDFLYEGRHNDRLERPLTIRKLAKAKSWLIGEGRAQVKEWGTGNGHARIITNSTEVAGRAPQEVAKEMKLKPIDVTAMANLWMGRG